MARRPTVFAPGLLYHVIARGNQRRKTFLSDDDYRAYLERLERYRTKFLVRGESRTQGEEIDRHGFEGNYAAARHNA